MSTMPKRKIWVDKEGNRYTRHLESKVSRNRLTGSLILVRRVYDCDATNAEAVCLDHGRYMVFRSLTDALSHGSVPEWCEYCCHKMWDECGPFCNSPDYYPYEECKLDKTSGDDPGLTADWLFDEEETKIGKRYRFELIPAS